MNPPQIRLPNGWPIWSRTRAPETPRGRLAAAPRGGLVEVAAQLPAAGRVAELPQRQALELPNALAGHPELLADFLERPGAPVGEPEPKLEDATLATA